MIKATGSAVNVKTILMYFGIKHEDYWHIDYPLHKTKYNCKNYFWDISKKATWFKGKKDNNNIVLYQGEDNKYYYNAIEVAQYSLGAYEEFLKTNSKKWLNVFLNHCNWLVENQSKFNQCNGVWINKFHVSLFNIRKDWVSGLGQSFGISALTRAYFETKNKKYLESAKKAILSFEIDVCDGGVLSKSGDFICIEEYTTKKRSSVLNGYISAIWAIYDLMQVDSNYQNLFELHTNNLEKNINRWDSGYWSWYDLWVEHSFIASYFYHNIHIKQLKILHKLTKAKRFDLYAKKWGKYQKNKFYAFKALIHKIIARLK